MKYSCVTDARRVCTNPQLLTCFLLPLYPWPSPCPNSNSPMGSVTTSSQLTLPHKFSRQVRGGSAGCSTREDKPERGGTSKTKEKAISFQNRLKVAKVEGCPWNTASSNLCSSSCRSSSEGGSWSTFGRTTLPLTMLPVCKMTMPIRSCCNFVGFYII
jgi:hypothetical protein